VVDEDDAVLNTVFGNFTLPVVAIETAVATAKSAYSALQSVIALVVQGWSPSSNTDVTPS